MKLAAYSCADIPALSNAELDRNEATDPTFDPAFVGAQRGGPDTGARALMRAVLQDAILCLQGEAPAVAADERQRRAAEAYRWVRSRDVGWLFSFESICHVLNLDANCLRRRLLSSHVALHPPDPVASAAGASRRTADSGLQFRRRRVQRIRKLEVRRRRVRPAHPARRRNSAHEQP